MCTRRHEGPLFGDRRITRLLRVHLRLPRVLVEDIVRAQCYTEVWSYSDGMCEKHGVVKRWNVDGWRAEIPYVNGKTHGIAEVLALGRLTPGDSVCERQE